jgi:signal transduction histidine kinase
MAVPSFMNPPRFEHRIKPRRDRSNAKFQQARESAKAGLQAPQSKAGPLATLTRAAQFLAHDLRHHLSTVYANAEFLCGCGIQSIDRDELLEEIRLAISCMTDQLDSLLLCTRTGHTMRPRRESLKNILDRAVLMVRSHPETRDVTIIQQEMPSLEGWLDGLKLASALFNLLLNACQAAKAGPEAKEVTIAIDQGSRYVQVRVLDSGPGVSDPIRKTLFQPFVKAEDTKGMGLGLTIARCIAREHGGEVYLEASRPGNTVFALSLPASLFCHLNIAQNSAQPSQTAPKSV